MRDPQGHAVVEICHAVREAAGWYSLYWDAEQPQASLRSVAIVPHFFNTDRYWTVDGVVRARRNELSRIHVEAMSNTGGGRLLVYEPDSTVSCGMAEAESKGFIDADDCPPWGLWVGFIQEPNGFNGVLSWIPNELVATVDAARDVCCVDESFYWLDTSERVIKKELLAALFGT